MRGPEWWNRKTPRSSPLTGTPKLQLFTGQVKITADGDCSHEIKRRLLLGRKVMTQPRQPIKKKRHYFADEGPSSQNYGFSSSCELDYKESWVPKYWCFWIVVLEKTLESPLDCKAIKPVHLKGNQSWKFIGRTDAEAETPIVWPPNVKNWFTWKDPDEGKDWRREEKGDDRGWDGWMATLTQWTWVCVNSRSWWWTGRPSVLQVHGAAMSWTWLSNWTELTGQVSMRMPWRPAEKIYN